MTTTAPSTLARELLDIATAMDVEDGIVTIDIRTASQAGKSDLVAELEALVDEMEAE